MLTDSSTALADDQNGNCSGRDSYHAGSLGNEYCIRQSKDPRMPVLPGEPGNGKTEAMEYTDILYNKPRHSRLGYLSPAFFAQKISRQPPSACNGRVYY